MYHKLGTYRYYIKERRTIVIKNIAHKICEVHKAKKTDIGYS